MVNFTDAEDQLNDNELAYVYIVCIYHISKHSLFMNFTVAMPLQ